MADDIFAKTMQACLESKKTDVTKKPADKKVVKKAITEKKEVKKAPAKKSFYESKGGRLFEEDDFDAEQQELDAYEADAEDANEIVDDVVDDIIVVVDPELDADEVSETAEDAQEIIDDTPEGEVPSTDEYVGDFTYTCPICGNTFFSSTELGEGDACPVCGDTPDGFVLVGEVAETDGMTDEEVADEVEDVVDDVVDDEEEIIDDEEELVDDAEDLELDVPEDEAEECAHRSAVRRESVKKAPVRRASLNLDESTFNPFLTKFVRENYKNARSLTVKKASLRNGKLTLECALTFKSGKSKKVTLMAEGFKRVGNSIVNVKDDGTFKVESKKVAPIKMKLSVAKNIVKCEGMKYDFVTVCEGRRARVMSAPIMESKKVAPVRKTVAKRTVKR